jgi:hypothetical protein
MRLDGGLKAEGDAGEAWGGGAAVGVGAAGGRGGS